MIFTKLIANIAESEQYQNHKMIADWSKGFAYNIDDIDRN